MTTTRTHFLENILLFPRMLRQAGLPISPEQTLNFVQAAALIDIASREELFHAARSMLVTRQEQLRLFETLFNRFWRVHARGEWANHGDWQTQKERRQRQRPYNVVSYMAHKARLADEAVDVADKSATFSNIELLQRKAFAEMSDEELDAVKQLIREMRWQVSLRETRRMAPASRGHKLELRRILRSATKYGGTPLELAWQERKIKQRPLVIIADISGSMEKYARILLQFAYSVSHSLKDVECFAFGTRLTRITTPLKLKNIDCAVGDAAREVVDWSGGTRIGESLQDFNRRWSRRVLRRGAVVVIISDGWERGDVTQLEQAMRFLHHRSHRLIWLNPLSGVSGYEPLVEGMAAALPYVDDFLPVHNMQSLIALSRRLASLGKHRSLRFPNATY